MRGRASVGKTKTLEAKQLASTANTELYINSRFAGRAGLGVKTEAASHSEPSYAYLVRNLN